MMRILIGAGAASILARDVARKSACEIEEQGMAGGHDQSEHEQREAAAVSCGFR